MNLVGLAATWAVASIASGLFFGRVLYRCRIADERVRLAADPLRRFDAGCAFRLRARSRRPSPNPLRQAAVARRN